MNRKNDMHSISKALRNCFDSMADRHQRCAPIFPPMRRYQQDPFVLGDLTQLIQRWMWDGEHLLEGVNHRVAGDHNPL